MRPARHDLGDVFFGHLFAQQSVAAFLDFLLDLVQLFLQLGNPSILQLARLCQLAAALRPLQFGPRLIELLLYFALIVDDRLFLLPFSLQRGRFLLQFGQFFFQLLQAFLAGRILFLSSAPGAPFRAA